MVIKVITFKYNLHFMHNISTIITIFYYYDIKGWIKNFIIKSYERLITGNMTFEY